MSRKTPPHIHHPHDGRGQRQVLLNGQPIERCLWADTRRGLVRVSHNPARLDKHRKRLLWKTLRGQVQVIPLAQAQILQLKGA